MFFFMFLFSSLNFVCVLFIKLVYDSPDRDDDNEQIENKPE